ncbi:MAG: O-antigen ligase family protein [Winogradskyella sp.]|jgi:hypothetical protein
MKFNLYKILFFILLVTLISARVELSFSFATAILFVSGRQKVSKPIGNILLIFSTLSFIGLFGIFKYDNFAGVYFKDIVYFLRPIVVLLASYFLIKKISDKEFFFTSIIVLGLVYSLIHVFNVVINFGDISNTAELRYYGGRYNHVEMVALIFILTSNHGKMKLYFNRVTYKMLVALLTVSFVLYFSRVMFVVLILFVLAYKGYFKLTKKGFRLIILGSLFITCFILVINRFDVDSNSRGVKAFIFKIQNSYSEMFESLDIETIKRDKRDLWKHWRGYEAQNAIEQIKDKGLPAWFLGKGFGSTIDLGVEVKLANQNMRYIPIIHNGIVYVLFKTGILGLIIYLFYIFYLYSYYRIKAKSNVQHNLNRLIVGCAFYIALSSLVITGVFKPYDLSGVVLGALFALKYYHNENRDSWNERGA